MSEISLPVLCIACSKTSCMACGRCGDPYCSHGCQQKDWPRHRSECVPMPRLVPHKILEEFFPVDSPTETLKEFLYPPPSQITPQIPVRAMPVVPHKIRPLRPETLQQFQKAPSEVSAKWQESVKLEGIPMKEVEVYFFALESASHTGWVMLAAHKPIFDEYIKLDADTLTLACPRIGDLVAIKNEKTLCRGKVMDELSESLYSIFLIDCGVTFNVEATKIYSPTKKMLESPALAFSVLLSPSDMPNIRLRERSVVNFLQINPPKVELCVPQMTGFVSHLVRKCVRSFRGKIAAFFGKDWMTLTVDTTDAKMIEKSLSVERTFHTAPKVEKGMAIVVTTSVDPLVKRRGLVMAADEKTMVVYLIDRGVFRVQEVPKEVQLLPTDLLLPPFGTVFLKLEKNLIPREDLYRDGLAIFVFELVHSNTAVKIVLESGKPVAEALVFEEPDLAKLGVHFWHQTPQPRSGVSVLGAKIISKKLFLSLHSFDKLDLVLEASKSAWTRTEKFLKTPPGVGDMVMYTTKDFSAVSRCLVMKVTGDKVELQHLDGPSVVELPFASLKAAPEVLRNTPVYYMEVPVADSLEIEEQDIEATLEFFSLKNVSSREFFLDYAGSPEEGVTLSLNAKGASLMTKLKSYLDTRKMEQLEAQRKKEVELKRIEQEKLEKRKRLEQELAALDASDGIGKLEIAEKTPEKPKDVVMFTDIKYIPLPKGDNYDLLLMDYDEDKGVIMVCQFSKENIQFVQDIVSVTTNHLATIDVKTAAGHEPILDEMCLVLYDTDETWYRGHCIGVDKDSYSFKLIDFGTVIQVTSKNIIKMPKELITPDPRTYTALVTGLAKEAWEGLEGQLYNKLTFFVESSGDNGRAKVRVVE